MVDAALALLDDDVALGPHDLLVQHEIFHAVGLQAHHLRQVLLGDALEVGGVVRGCEGVFLAADRGHEPGERAIGIVGRPLEHQMFEEMRDPGAAGRLVGGADLVPDHVRDDGGTAVGDDHHVHAVRQREGLNAGNECVGAAYSRNESGQRERGHKSGGENTARHVRHHRSKSFLLNFGLPYRCLQT